MSRWQITLLLAGWEFRRFFKWKNQLIATTIIALAMVSMAVIGPRFVERAVSATAEVGVVGETPFELPPAMGLTYRHGTEDALRTAYDDREIGGLLTLASDSKGTLESHGEAGWLHGLQAALNEARRGSRLAHHALDPDVLADLNEPFQLELVHPAAEGDTPSAHASCEDDSEPSQRPSGWDKIIAFTLLGFMVMGVFTGTALLFTGITSEKQQLVTEQIVAAVPPQAWIDGKILGTGFQAIVSLFEMIAWSLVGMILWRDFVNHDFAGLDQLSPGLLLTVGALAICGFCLWFCFFAAVAATIDDPNTSARGVLIMAPMLAPVLAIPAYFHPESGLALFSSLFPPSAPMALTVRMVISEVPTWQIVVALLGLSLSTAVLRRAAGKVFAMAILMRGKELSWLEMWRAARAAD